MSPNAMRPFISKNRAAISWSLTSGSLQYTYIQSVVWSPATTRCSNVAFEELHNKDSNNNKIQFHVFVSCKVCSAGRRAASIWNGIKPSHGRQTETQEPNESPHPPRKNYKCSSFVTASVAFLMGVVVLKYIVIFLIIRSWQCIILDTPWGLLGWRTHWCHQILNKSNR